MDHPDLFTSSPAGLMPSTSAQAGLLKAGLTSSLGGQSVTRPAWADRFRAIVFEGPIGVGKSSLARKFSERFGYGLTLEAAQDNPFLAKFYRDAARYALPAQLFFLFQRVDQLRELSQRDLFLEHRVSDFMIEKDPLFARLTLTEEEHQLYDKIFQSLKPQLPAPDLVVALHASPSELVRRIRQRGIPMEQNISTSYLSSLSEAYTQYFHDYDASPVLLVNTATLNPIDREPDFEALVHQIATFRGRRAFFNHRP